MSVATPAPSPYKGLMPYDEEDWEFFFGRNADRAVIAANLRGSRLTLFYGPSGVGKSSVLAAGVGHDVRELAERNRDEVGHPGFAFVHFRAWRDDPLAGLLAAVRKSVEAATGLDFAPATPGLPLDRALEEWADRLDGTLLIILDQFEEYFLYHPREDGEGTFAGEFPRAVTRPGLRANVMLSIRDDALAKLDRFEGRIPGLFANYVRIDPLRREGAREAIEGPIAPYNARYPSPDGPASIAPGLADAVLAQVRAGRVTLRAAGRGVIGGLDDAGSLDDDAIDTSYLQLVMERLWEEERRLGSRRLRPETLAALGGAQTIVRRHLDKVLGGLDRDDLRVAEDVLPYLVTPSGSKIAQEPAALAKWAERPEDRVRAVLERLASQRGRILRRVESADRAESYEVFHDVLAKVILDKVAELETEHARERARQEAERARQEAEARAARERERRRWLSLVVVALSAVLALTAVLGAFAFVESRRAREQRNKADIAARAARDAAERAEKQTAIAKEQAEIANREKGRADAEAKRAESRRLAVIAGTEAVRRVDLALLLSLEALRLEETAEARRSLLYPMSRRPGLASFLHWPVDGIECVAYHPDGRTLALGGRARVGSDVHGVVTLWDVASGTRLGTTLDAGAGGIDSLAFSPDGKALAAGGYDHGGTNYTGAITLWDVATGARRGSVTGAGVGIIYGVAFSPDGKTLAAGSSGTADLVSLWDVETGSRRGAPLDTGGGTVHSVAFSPDGKTLAAGGGYGTSGAGVRGVVTLWDVASGKRRMPPLDAGTRMVQGVAVSPDGEAVAAGLSGGAGPNRRAEVILWGVATGTRRGESLDAGDGEVLDLAFSPDGKTLAVGGTAGEGSEQDGVVTLWDVATGARRDPSLDVGAGRVSGLAFSPDGTALAASGGGRGTFATVWDLSSGSRWGAPLDTGTGGVKSLAFSPDDTVLAAGGRAGEGDKQHGVVTLWDVATGTRRGDTLHAGAGEIEGVAFGPDGKTLVAGGYVREGTNSSGVVALLGVASGERRDLPQAPGVKSVSGVAFSPDGKTIAAVGVGPEAREDSTADGIIMLWDAATGARRGPPLVAGGGVRTVEFGPDGKTLVVGGDTGKGATYRGVVTLWDVASRKRRGTPLDLGNAGIISLALRPDGEALAASGYGSSVTLWDLASRTSRTLPMESSVISLAFSPDGKTLAAGCSYGGRTAASYWEVAAGPQKSIYLDTCQQGNVYGLAYSHDGKILAAGACTYGKRPGGPLFLWSTDLDAWKARARRIVNRNLSWDEWSRFLGPEVPYHRTCPDLPDGEGVADAAKQPR